MSWGMIGAAAVSVVGGAIAKKEAGNGGGPASGDPSGTADPFGSQRPQYASMMQNLMTGNGGGGAPSGGGGYPASTAPSQQNFPQNFTMGGRARTFSDDGGGGDPYSGGSPMGDGAHTPTGAPIPRYNPQGQPPQNSFTSDPSYQFRLEQGLEATDRRMAAGGFLNSGNRAAELNNYAQGQASTEFQNQFSRLAQLSGANIGSPAAAAQIQQQQQAASAAGTQQLITAGAGLLKHWWDSPSDSGAPADNNNNGLGDGSAPVFTDYGYD